MEKLGEGCSAEVYKCEHSILKQMRAVKIMRAEDDEYTEIAKQEFALLRPLNHPNVVKVFDCIHDEQKRSLYLIMEFIQGQTLEDFVLKASSSNKPLPEDVILTILKQLLKAVAYLHENGVCHRDLKPDNIMINPKTHHIKLTDFNISRKFLDDKKNRKKMRTMTGLDMWSAPETRQGIEYNENVDLWGVGVICYYMVMMFPPFNDSDEMKLIDKVQKCEF